LLKLFQCYFGDFFLYVWHIFVHSLYDDVGTFYSVQILHVLSFSNMNSALVWRLSFISSLVLIVRSYQGFHTVKICNRIWGEESWRVFVLYWYIFTKICVDILIWETHTNCIFGQSKSLTKREKSFWFPFKLFIFTKLLVYRLCMNTLLGIVFGISNYI